MYVAEVVFLTVLLVRPKEHYVVRRPVALFTQPGHRRRLALLKEGEDWKLRITRLMATYIVSHKLPDLLTSAGPLSVAELHELLPRVFEPFGNVDFFTRS